MVWWWWQCRLQEGNATTGTGHFPGLLASLTYGRGTPLAAINFQPSWVGSLAWFLCPFGWEAYT